MTELEKIRSNAELVVNKLGPISGFQECFGYDRDSLVWVEGFIERQRNGNPTPEQMEKLVQVLGSYLGECVIHRYGGEWREHEHQWGVWFSDSDAVFPFAKVAKQFKYGLEEGDSIVGFFDLIEPVIIKKSL